MTGSLSAGESARAGRNGISPNPAALLFKREVHCFNWPITSNQSPFSRSPDVLAESPFTVSAPPVCAVAAAEVVVVEVYLTGTEDCAADAPQSANATALPPV